MTLIQRLQLLLVIGLLAQPLGVVRVDARGLGTERIGRHVSMHDGNGVTVLGLLTPRRGPDPTGFALLDKTSIAAAGSITSTAPINTTGAKLLVVMAVYTTNGVGPPTISDSSGNTWIQRTGYGTATCSVSLWYVINPTTAASHSATLTPVGGGSFQAFSFSAWSAGGAVTYQTPSGENGNSSGSATSLATNTVTPATTNALCLSVVGFKTQGYTSVNSGIVTMPGVAYSAGQNHALQIGYRIMTAPVAMNVTWTLAAPADEVAAGLWIFRNH